MANLKPKIYHSKNVIEKELKRQKSINSILSDIETPNLLSVETSSSSTAPTPSSTPTSSSTPVLSTPTVTPEERKELLEKKFNDLKIRLTELNEKLRKAEKLVPAPSSSTSIPTSSSTPASSSTVASTTTPTSSSSSATSTTTPLASQTPSTTSSATSGS